RKNISDILQFEVKNDNIGFVTVTDCRVSKENMYARIYVSFLGAKNPQNNLAALNKIKGFIRTSLSKKLDIWKVPEIEFVYDDSIDRVMKLEESLHKEKASLDKLKSENESKD
ncbi:MAG: 30S ribosome-binding factor RbfA, partial [Bacilli bacterium]